MKKESSAIDWQKQGIKFLERLHGIPVIETPHIKEPTFLVPIGYAEKVMEEQKKLLGIKPQTQ